MQRKRVTFEVSAPHARKACLVGDFNAWNSETHPMKRERTGKWRLGLLIPPGTYRYAVMIDGKLVNKSTSIDIEPRRFRAANSQLNVYFSWTREI